jgi:transcriptional regulator with GAF, ATPase, and Fis domain
MTRKPARPPGHAEKQAFQARLTKLLEDLKEAVGAADGRSFAEAAFAESAAQVFDPQAAAASSPAGDEASEPARSRAAPTSREVLKFDYHEIVGKSPAILSLLGMLDRVIESELPVLITGESGTGKELVARAIHAHGPRKGRTFVRENCAAIPESLLESELFGYRRGAFTGALQDKRGLFEEADGGSVFLDEIGEMSLNMQAKLMRVLQEGEIRPVGAPTTLTVDVRLISATNRDLKKLVAEGRFREDLFFRLNVILVHLPPLRERTDDIPLLVDAFLAAAAARSHAPAKPLDPDALAALVAHAWPGNVRELENEVQRAFALSGPKIGLEDLSPEVRPVARKTRQSSNSKPR